MSLTTRFLKFQLIQLYNMFSQTFLCSGSYILCIWSPYTIFLWFQIKLSFRSYLYVDRNAVCWLIWSSVLYENIIVYHIKDSSGPIQHLFYYQCLQLLVLVQLCWICCGWMMWKSLQEEEDPGKQNICNIIQYILHNLVVCVQYASATRACYGFLVGWVGNKWISWWTTTSSCEGSVCPQGVWGYSETLCQWVPLSSCSVRAHCLIWIIKFYSQEAT